ncbi:MAG: TspO/MBR family protein [Candidatus Eremiobacteraeota bacterium]|nr:TspO/MBR family protein [Candidatus Eremiobacteraeota bacterium]
MSFSRIISLIACIVLCEAAGALGALFTSRSVSTWYQAIKKPFFNPPGWVFAPVWTLLYALMGISLFLIIREGFKNRPVQIAVALFAVQMAFNVSWSYAFFGLRSPLAGLVIIILLWISIIAAMISFWPISRWASSLFIPYVLWVTFAMILNLFLYLLNRNAPPV